jgi:hypothetical protein
VTNHLNITANSIFIFKTKFRAWIRGPRGCFLRKKWKSKFLCKCTFKAVLGFFYGVTTDFTAPGFTVLVRWIWCCLRKCFLAVKTIWKIRHCPHQLKKSSPFTSLLSEISRFFHHSHSKRREKIFADCPSWAKIWQVGKQTVFRKFVGTGSNCTNHFRK